MKIFITIFGLIIFVASCQTKQADTKTTIENPKVTLQFSIVDTLNKYHNTDSLFIFPNKHIIYVGNANNQDFGLVSLTDTSFAVYQRANNIWGITDTITESLNVVFKPQDLNGDNFKDIIITYAISGAGGNGQNICLLFNPKTKIFYHNKYFDLPNIKYDSKRNLVLSAWWAGTTHPQEKMTYNITGDSLTFNEGVTYTPPEETNLKIATVELYSMKGDERIIEKKFKGTPDKMIDLFHKTFWDTTNE